MRRIFLVVALALALPFYVGGQKSKKAAPAKAAAGSVEEQLKNLEQDRAQAVVRGDADYLDKQTTSDYTLIDTQGRVFNKSETLDRIRSGKIKLTSNKVDDLKARVYGNTAVVTGRSTTEGTVDGKDSSGQTRFTRVFVKQGGEWKSVAFQQTRVAGAGAAAGTPKKKK